MEADSLQGQLVCSDPHIWVFDGLISEAVLQRVDEAFEQVGWKSVNGRQVRMVELSVDEALEELPRTLCKISRIEEVAPCGKIWIMDVQGRDQTAHMDGWEVSRSREAMKQLDLSKCSVQTHEGFSTVIPTLSFVIYFNDVGGCTFPKAALADPTIPAKRGRILMFHNYNDALRPAHNPAAAHYGVYGDAPKRVMTAGVLSHETPRELLGEKSDHKTRGFLYAPIMHRSNTSCGEPEYYRTPSPPPAPKPKPVFQLMARRAEEADGIIIEAYTMGGGLAGKVMVKRTDTLSTLRQALPDALLVAGDEVLDGDDKQLLDDTFMVKDLFAPRAEGSGEASGKQATAAVSVHGRPTMALHVETLVEWDVIDTKFV